MNGSTPLETKNTQGKEVQLQDKVKPVQNLNQISQENLDNSKVDIKQRKDFRGRDDDDGEEDEDGDEDQEDYDDYGDYDESDPNAQSMQDKKANEQDQQVKAQKDSEEEYSDDDF